MDVTHRTEFTRKVLKPDQGIPDQYFPKQAVRWSYRGKKGKLKGWEKILNGTKFRNQRSSFFYFSRRSQTGPTSDRRRDRWAERGERNQKLKNIYLQCEGRGHGHMVVEVVVGACLCLQEGSRSCSKPLPPLLSLMSSTALSPSSLPQQEGAKEKGSEQSGAATNTEDRTARTCMQQLHSTAQHKGSGRRTELLTWIRVPSLAPPLLVCLFIYGFMHVKDPAFPGHIIINKQINTGLCFFWWLKSLFIYIMIHQSKRRKKGEETKS